jgi:hypothetical protein
MNKKQTSIELLEKKIIGLLNKLKENHLNFIKLQERNIVLERSTEELENKLLIIQDKNKSLIIANNLLGSNEGKSQTKTKINSLIKEVDICINHLSEIN